MQTAIPKNKFIIGNEDICFHILSYYYNVCKTLGANKEVDREKDGRYVAMKENISNLIDRMKSLLKYK